MFTGALERLRVRLEDGAATPLLSFVDGTAPPRCEVTRTQHEQRGFAVRPGQSVAIGVRRMHVLPTPLSSFTACATSAAHAEALVRQPLLVALAARMKTRVAVRVEPRLGVADAPCENAAAVRRHRRARLADRRAPTARVAAAARRRGRAGAAAARRRPAARADSLDGRGGARRHARGGGQPAAPRVRRGRVRRIVPDDGAGGRWHARAARCALRGARRCTAWRSAPSCASATSPRSWHGAWASRAGQMLILGVGAIWRASPSASRAVLRRPDDGRC